MTSVLTVTSNRGYEASGTVLSNRRTQGGQDSYKAGVNEFNSKNQELHRSAVLDGDPLLAGWINTTESRWGDSVFMVPNAANRLLLFPSWRPHGVWIPDRHLLTKDIQDDGRLILTASWMMHTTGKATREYFCQSRIAGNPMRAAEDAIKACMRCSAWRDCAWYPQTNSCQPSSSNYGRRAIRAKKPKSRGDPFSCGRIG